jgi:hypothetical protein
MASYASKLVEQRGKRDDAELAWELAEALNEKRSRGEALTPSEQIAWHAYVVATCDGIEDVLSSSPESVKATADFARRRGLSKTAEILSNAAMDVPVPGPVSMQGRIGGREISIPLPIGKWGATDLMLSMIDENLETAILDFVAENASDFDVGPSTKTTREDAFASKVAALAASRTPVQLLDELLSHRNPRIRAQLPDDQHTGTPSDWLEVPVVHRPNAPADATRIARLATEYGPAAESLLELYAKHNGAELFVAKGEPGFVLLPIEAWPEHIADVMDWARQVTWQDEPEEIPGYLESSIPFGHIPGDSERWLLITQGEHAGKVMLSDSDVSVEEPRFASLAEVFAAMIVDVKRVVGCGGYVSYGAGLFQGSYYPEEYGHD